MKNIAIIGNDYYHGDVNYMRTPLFGKCEWKTFLKPGVHQYDTYTITVAGTSVEPYLPALGDAPRNASVLEKKVFELEREKAKAELQAKNHYAARAMQIINDAGKYDEIIVFAGNQGTEFSWLARDAVEKLYWDSHGQASITVVSPEWYRPRFAVPTKEVLGFRKGKLERLGDEYDSFCKNGISIMISKEHDAGDVFEHLVNEHTTPKPG